MLSYPDLINLMVSEPSWEDVIVRIVAEEGLDPWDLDLVRLADSFIEYLKKIEQLDLRIPARFILIAAILLRMKSDVLVAKRAKKAGRAATQDDSELLKILAQIPPLQPPAKRIPVGPVSMEELITALKKAFEVRERRQKRKERIRARVRAVLAPDEEDITKRISQLLDRINEIITDIEGSTTFSSLVRKWERKEIVRTLLPMLHLAQEGKITHEQPVLFEEIIIKKK